MESIESKKLVMVGIRRKGEKSFKTRVRHDAEVSPIDLSNLHIPITTRMLTEEDTHIKQQQG